jgi:hypothetical protein
MTANDLISVKDAGLQLGKRKQTIFKIIKRLDIDVKKRRDSASKNQFVAYITEADLERIKEEISLRVTKLEDESQVSSGYAETDEMGVFYLIQLEPDHDSGRFKVGFAVNMPDRLRAHRCAAPFSKVVKKWPCKRLWEKTAIDCITSTCERLHTEVYRSQSLDEIINKADEFFNLMPQVEKAK